MSSCGCLTTASRRDNSRSNRRATVRQSQSLSRQQTPHHALRCKHAHHHSLAGRHDILQGQKQFEPHLSQRPCNVHTTIRPGVAHHPTLELKTPALRGRPTTATVDATHLFEERCDMLLRCQHIRRHDVLVAPAAAASPAVEALGCPLDVNRPNVLSRGGNKKKRTAKNQAPPEGVSPPQQSVSTKDSQHGRTAKNFS